jgi:serine protease
MLLLVPLVTSLMVACGADSDEERLSGNTNIQEEILGDANADNLGGTTQRVAPQNSTPQSIDDGVTVVGTITGLVGEVTIRLNTTDYEESITTTDSSFIFSGKATVGQAYAITIPSQPSNQFCTISNDNGMVSVDTADPIVVSIECVDILLPLTGVVTGLSNTVTLVLQVGGIAVEELPVTTGTFTFGTQLGIGAEYSVSIRQHPTGQTCTLENEFGTAFSDAPPIVTITCEDLSPVIATVSGTISLNDNILSDSDLNDPTARFRDNSTFATAQSIPNNVTVQGFATLIPTNNTADQFSDRVDEHDYYSVTLEQGQALQLQVVDYDQTVNPNLQGDLDLYLFDTAFNLVAFSNLTTPMETITIPRNGQYYVDVVASSGGSKYVLTILPSAPTNIVNQSVDFVPNEAIVRVDGGATSFSSARAMANMRLRHQQNDRANLAGFANMTSYAAAAEHSRLNNTGMSELAALNPESYEKVATLKQIKFMQDDPEITQVEPNYFRQAKLMPNDEFYDLQWHYRAMNLPQAWDITTGRPEAGENDVIVAVVDTGIVMDHPEFVGQLVPGYDFISSPTNARDGNGIDSNPDDVGNSPNLGQSSWHGSHVAGTIAARSDNGIGVAGVSWGAKIMPLRVLGSFGGTTYDMMQAVRFAAGLRNDSGIVPDQPADIINLSLGGPAFSEAEAALFERVNSEGIIVVAAAGNENSGLPSYPAAYTGVISVAALDFNQARARYSNFGDTIDIAAPGGDIFADNNDDGFVDGVLSTVVNDVSGERIATLDFYHGTSMAAPHVSGMAALMKAVYPELDASSFDALLQNGLLTNEAGEAGRDNIFGYGIADAHKAVLIAQSLANDAQYVPPLPTSLIAQPSLLNIGTLPFGQITLLSAGDDPVVLGSITPSEDWLTVTPDTVDDDGFGLYTVSVNREGLNEGGYTATITISASGTNPNVITVSMTVGALVSPGRLSSIYSVLVDAVSNEVVAQSVATDNEDGTASFTLPDVPAGYYHLFAGSDIDNDLNLCTAGEGCGAYPSLTELQTVLINGEDFVGMDFSVDIINDHITFGEAPLNLIESPIQRMSSDARNVTRTTNTLLLTPQFR